MGDTFHQLGQLFVETIPTVVLVFLLFIILDRILFRPLIAVMKKRDELSAGAVARAKDEAAAVVEKTRQYDETFQAARQEVYRQRETDRQKSLEQRDAALKQVRGQAEQVIHQARTELAGEVLRTKADLDGDCIPLAEEISQSLVGGPGGFPA
jgi:F-type H+-transporting ATPase subunit b